MWVSLGKLRDAHLFDMENLDFHKSGIFAKFQLLNFNKQPYKCTIFANQCTFYSNIPET